jgi:hypothetical protein
MCISIFYAQVVGLWLFLLGLAMVMDENRYKKAMSESLTNHILMNFMGLVTLGLGLVLVITHNIWVASWPVLITLAGWILLAQGIMRLFFADRFSKIMKDILASSGFTVVSWAWLLVGLYLTWAGFAA